MSDPLLDKYGIADPYLGAFYHAGWAKTIEALIQELIALGWDKDLHQLKDKFGGMRFYIGKGNPSLYNAISKAEALTMDLCVDCGANVGERHNYFTSLRCAECVAKQKPSQTP